MEKTCKNCGKLTTGNFCANCGQKTSVHRYSFKHFIQNNLIHGIWSINNGLFFTIKELFTRPGHSIREFIYGKRVGYFNVVTLLIIILGVSLFIGEYSQVKLSDLMPDDSSKSVMSEIETFTKKYPKAILLITIPFYTLFSFLWFRKSKLNLSEHLILNSYKTAGELLIGLIFTIITVFYTNYTGLILINSLVALVSLIYAFWFYAQFFSTYEYSKKSLIIRSLLTTFSFFIFSVLFGIVMGFIKGVKGVS